jgi:putative Holliday junction resolvase
MGRILCIDYGLRRTGLAVSDPTRTIASALATIEHRDETALVNQLKPVIAEQEVDEIVLGLPLSQSGRPSARSAQVTAFGSRLAHLFKLPVHYCDERFSTSRAQQLLDEVYGDPAPRRGTPRRKTPSVQRKASALDRIAAVLILEDFLRNLRSPNSDLRSADHERD